jgi:multiple sugar transport system permease protein
MRSNRTGWLLLSPTLIILFVVGFLPFFYVLWVGFHNWNIFAAREGMFWAGVDNYRRLVFDNDFLTSMGLTLRFTLIVVASEIILGYLLAQLLVRNFPGKTLFRIVHTIPLMIAPLVVGAIWRLLTVPGLGPLPFYMDRWFDVDYNIGRYADQAFLTVILMDLWHWTPFVTLTMLAGLSALPQEPIEAAMVDGANRWQLFRHIKLPMLSPVILTTMFIRIMDALRIVDEVYMLTNGGGPGTSNRYIGIHIFRVVFPKTDYGYGSAMSLLVLYITIVICWMLFTALAQQRKI